MTLLAISMLASCAKNLQPGDPIPGLPSRFSDLKVGSSFTWATTKTITVNVDGFNTESTVRKSLLISGKNMTGNYYRGNHLMNEDVVVKINVPTALDSVVVTYGSIVKTYPVTGTVIYADYIVNYPETTE